MTINFLITFISILIKLLYWAIFINILLSWFAQTRTGFGHWLDEIVRPILWPFKWARIGMFDFSPILALLALEFLGKFLIEYLSQFAV